MQYACEKLSLPAPLRRTRVPGRYASNIHSSTPRAVFAFDRFAPGLRGAVRRMERAKSFDPGRLSTQAKQRRSSTISCQAT